MAAPRQLELIAWDNPLGRRVGAEFFRELPAAPGVYRMLSAEAEVLYVGSSRQLRHRVSSYRSITPTRHSRRLCRLVHAVAAIVIELTGTEAEARILEASWIRHYRPRYNRALNRPEETVWIGLRLLPTERRLETRWTRERESLDLWPAATQVSGPFSHFKAVSRLHSLRRILWWLGQPRADLRDCPPEFLRRDRPTRDWIQTWPAELPLALEAPDPTPMLLAAAEAARERLALLPWNAPLLEWWEHDREVLAAGLAGVGLVSAGPGG
jgi:hypothetical protein